MSDLFQCGYICSSLVTISNKFHATDSAGKYLYFCTQFEGTHIHFQEEFYFTRKYKSFIQFMRKNKFHGDARKNFVKEFSLEKWNKLANETKLKHSLHRCEQCEIQGKHRSFVKEKKTPMKDISNTVEIPLVQQKTPPLVKEAAKTMFEDMSQKWNKIYDTPLTKILPKIPSTGLVEKKTNSELKQRMRKLQRKIKAKIEESWTSNGKDVSTFYGSRQSAAAYGKQRASLFFDRKSKLNYIFYETHTEYFIKYISHHCLTYH